jgi:hypothetical protein
MSYLNVPFDQWRKIILKNKFNYHGKLRDGHYCQLCKKCFVSKTHHKKSWKHIMHWNNYEEKRYDYIVDEKKQQRLLM